MSRMAELHTGWVKDPAYRKEYDALEGEFALAATLIRARAEAGLTQEQLAERMGTKQEVVARWEGGKVMPSTRTLARLAKAVGTTLRISFAPRPRFPHVAAAMREFDAAGGALVPIEPNGRGELV